MNQQRHFQRVLTCVFFLIFSVEGFTGTGMPVHQSSSSSSQLHMYAPKPSQSPPKVAQQMIPNPSSIAPTSSSSMDKKKDPPQQQKQRYNTKLSHSVLADCDTLPSFPTAHGLLSPETVMRMEEMVELEEGASSAAVGQFLRRYRRSGPMSCLSMLSDPDVLPHLTKAMRDVV